MNRLFLFIAILLIWSCSTPQQQAGGSDLPNGIVSGIVVTSEGGKGSDAKVILSEITLTSKGDTTTWSQSVETDADGAFTISDVESGSYVLHVQLPNGESFINSRFTKNSIEVENITLHTEKTNTLYGRVVSEVNLPTHVKVAGTDIKASIDNDGFYTLADVPQGEVECIILDGNHTAVLPIEINGSAERDTLFIRDTRFSTTQGDPYDFHMTQGEALLAYPLYYSPTQQPEWYSSRDFSGVYYQDLESGDPRDVWDISTMVVIPQETADHYGSTEETKAAVLRSFSQANNYFAGANLTGKLYFSVDSIHFQNNSVITNVSDTFSSAVIFDVTNSITGTPWSFETKTAIADTANLEQILALTRGAKDLSNYYVSGQDNSINSSPFIRNELLLWGDGGNELDEMSLFRINSNQNNPVTPVAVTPNDFPEEIEVFVTENGTSVSAEILVYGVSRETNDIIISPRYNSLTNDKGIYTFPEIPFTDGDVYSPYNNFLLEVKYNGKAHYKWMPEFEVQGNFLNSGNRIYRIDFEI